MLNKIQCAELYGNTGTGSCFLIPANIVGAFLTPVGFKITQADAGNIVEFLKQAAQADKASERIFPLPPFVETEDGSEDATIQTFGYGGRAKVRDGFYDWTFRFIQGGVLLNRELRKFNGTRKGVLFFDADGNLFGYNNNGDLQAVPLEMIDVKKWGLNDGSNVASFRIQFVMNSAYLTDHVGFAKVNEPLSEVQGLQNINLRVISATDTTIKFKAETDGSDLYDMYAETIGDLVEVRDANGVALATDSIATDPTIKGWTITLAAPGRTGAVVLMLKAVSELANAGIVGFEGRSVTVPA